MSDDVDQFLSITEGKGDDVDQFLDSTKEHDQKSTTDHTTQGNTNDRSKLWSALLGGVQGLTLGFGDELAGVGGGLFDAADSLVHLHGLKDAGESFRHGYDESAAVARNQNRAAQEAHPWIYGAGQVAGGIVPGVLGASSTKALPLVGKLAPYAKGIIDGGLQGAIAGAGYADNGDRLKGAGIGGATGAAAGSVLPLVGKGIKYGYEKTKGAIGSALQVPQKVSESAYSKIGSVLPEELEKPIKEPEYPSAKWKELQRIIDLGSDEGEAVVAAQDSAKNSGVFNKTAASMTTEDKSAMADAIASGLQKKGIAVNKDAVVNKIDDLLSDFSPDGDKKGGELLKMIVRDDPAKAVKRLMTSGKFYSPDMVSNQDPRFADLLRRGGDLRGDFEAGKLNRAFGPSSDDFVRQVDFKDPPPPAAETSTEASSAPRAVNDYWKSMIRDQTKIDIPREYSPGPGISSPYRDPVTPPSANGDFNLSRGDVEAIRQNQWDAFVKKMVSQADPSETEWRDHADILAPQIDQVMRGEARPFSSTLGSGESTRPGVRPQSIGPGESTKPEGLPPSRRGERGFITPFAKVPPKPPMTPAQALEWQQNVSNGRRMMDVAGLGQQHHLQNVVDMAGGFGQALERSSKDALSPGKLNASYLMNPNLLQRLAQGQGPAANAARWALQGTQGQGIEGLIARSYVLSQQPELRKMFSTDQR